MAETRTLITTPNYDNTIHMRAMVQPTAHREVGTSAFQNSLAPRSFTHCWLTAMDAAQTQGFTHFAMQHTDVLPQALWLDVLHDEMERLDCDIISAVVPIKTTEGRTSTAVDRVVNGVLMQRNLTLAEVYRLPETFCAEDVEPGCRLLVNTGLWLCRLDRPWCDYVNFQHVTWIDRRGEVPILTQESEDWLMSRQLNQLGVKLYATRKVKLSHRGYYEFSNEKPWGTETFTQYVPTHSVVPGYDPDYHPPGVIHGR